MPVARATDVVCAKYWYSEVEMSTSFRPYEAKPEKVPERLHEIYGKCREVYEKLHAYRLQ